MELSFIPDQTLEGKQNQHLSLTHAMQQSLKILQLPTLELVDLITSEVQDNVLLEFGDDSRAESEYDPEQTRQENKQRSYLESLLEKKPSLFEHLMGEVHTLSLDSGELKIAEEIIGNLDERGFYPQGAATPAEARVLEQIKTLEPKGIAAKNLQECLLLQLRAKGLGRSLAAALVEKHYSALHKAKMVSLLKLLDCTVDELQAALGHLRTLTLNPASSFEPTLSSPIEADIVLHHDGEKWSIELADERLPTFRFAKSALVHFMRAPPQDKQALRPYLNRGRWLMKALHQRERTLKRLLELVIKKNGRYLLGESRVLMPLTLQEASDALHMHASTLSRAVCNKYIECPAGLFSLRALFARSSGRAEVLLKDLLAKEKSAKPLTDEQLTLKLHAQGVDISRRTVAKARKKLRIPAAHRRRS